MNKQETYQWLTDHQIPYEVTEHKPVFSMEDLRDVHLPYPEANAKNLFVHDRKKRHFYLILVRGEKRVDLKAFAKQQGLKSLSFCSEDDLKAILGLTPGSVTPLGLLNDDERRVHFYIDAEFAGNKVAAHPMENTATVWLNADDLVQLVRDHGNEAEYVDIPVLPEE
ncbi:prolyl-tRNA synthetase associated domain-containing protein [Lactobacillus equicursoris]|uniref:Prolyl-tRNA synthetase associated domain-containing protein n=1 Tax=Lactobacillus equicursoris TaxID=420645 RepID=A0A844FME3_9LACO|nr:prolyl-tRNA synthetase associated domain-containing protein [Lactobacillus equicursoris]MST79392.1 prolyl-tRNA synthetase associated domain-containing protein [Lactobacillus equicursoris]